MCSIEERSEQILEG